MTKDEAENVVTRLEKMLQEATATGLIVAAVADDRYGDVAVPLKRWPDGKWLHIYADEYDTGVVVGVEMLPEYRGVGRYRYTGGEFIMEPLSRAAVQNTYVSKNFYYDDSFEDIVMWLEQTIQLQKEN